MKKFIVVLVLAGLLVWLIRLSGQYLIVNNPQKSDVIVVLAGDVNDVRYRRGMELLRNGYAHDLLLDASEDFTLYGKTFVAAAAEFVRADAGPLAAHVHVCPIRGDSTASEARYVANCLAPYHPRAVLLVTSDFHTRRASSIFPRKLPQYRWSTAAAGDPYIFQPKWWRTRESVKTTFLEWQKLIWWSVVERWR